MKRILVPCDFSRQARAAFKTAVNWAAKTNGEVVLLYATFVPAVYGGFGIETITYSPEYLDALDKESKSEFERMKKEINMPLVKSTLKLVYGDVLASIKNFMEENQMDMIVMGTSGSAGMAEIFIGSNTEKVLRYATVPVFAVRDYVDVSSIKKILLPTQMNLDQTEFMKKLKELQKFLDATLHVLFVNNPVNFMRDAEAKGAFDEFAKHYKLENCEFHFQNYRNEKEGIIDFASTQKMDMIAMATHARKGLAHIFNGSITEDVVNHITSPVWTYALNK